VSCWYGSVHGITWLCNPCNDVGSLNRCLTLVVRAFVDDSCRQRPIPRSVFTFALAIRSDAHSQCESEGAFVENDRPTSAPYRIAIADNQARTRSAVRALLQDQFEFEVCAEAGNSVEAIQCVKREAPDLLVLDLAMPNPDTFEVARVVKDEAPATAILILLMNFSPAVTGLLLRYGIRGFVLKTDADSELLDAIRFIKQGKCFYSRGLAEALGIRFAREVRRKGKSSVPDEPRLSPREMEIVELLCKGFLNKEVARTLGISVRTAESHRSRIMRKMNFSNFTDLVRYAIRAGIIES
jgi:two-component system, NarL family, response regulator NreC